MFKYIYNQVNAFSSLPRYTGFHRYKDRVIIILYLKYCDNTTPNPGTEVVGLAADILWAVLKHLQLDDPSDRDKESVYIYVGKQYHAINEALRSPSLTRRWHAARLARKIPTCNALIARLQPYEPSTPWPAPTEQTTYIPEAYMVYPPEAYTLELEAIDNDALLAF